mmetsp:Transcript_3769/g.9420  ORF Transcript_3769/g.9420 Transcript_3769/m.9420 type:complete len:123 (-) Transcript_3769:413-781(-)
MNAPNTINYVRSALHIHPSVCHEDCLAGAVACVACVACVWVDLSASDGSRDAAINAPPNPRRKTICGLEEMLLRTSAAVALSLSLSLFHRCTDGLSELARSRSENDDIGMSPPRYPPLNGAA